MATVVIVEDEDRIRKVVATILEHAGHQVLSFANPGAELFGLDYETVDLLIIDLAMPTRGEEAIYTLRSSGVSVPIIVLNAFIQENDGLVLEAIGADRVLSKPCATTLLRETVDELLSPH